MTRAVLGMAITAAAAALSGCASAVYEGKYAWAAGWRDAKVVRLAPATELGGRHSSDCRYGTGSGEDGAALYAVLKYRDVGRERRAVVPASADSGLAPGDAVYANIRTCVSSDVVRHR